MLAFFKELTAVVVGAVIVASLLRGFVGQMFLIPSVSMENTLRVEDRVVVEKLSPIERGEVIVFSDPGGWLIGTTARGLDWEGLEFVGVLPDTGTEHHQARDRHCWGSCDLLRRSRPPHRERPSAQ